MRSAERVNRRLRDGALARTDGLMRVAHAGAVLAVFALCGCATELTEIIVIVDSELAVPGELDEIVVTTEGASGLPKGASANLAGAGAASMPVTVGLRPGGAYDGPVTIRVRGRHAGDERVSAQVHTRFIAGARLVLRIDLASECVRILCGDEATCRNGFCVPYEVDPTELPRFTGTLPGRVDDAGRDLGPRDGGLDATHRDGSIVCTSNAECDDGETCNGLERSDAGACLPGTPMNCEDAFDFTSGSCTEAGGCRHLGDDSRCAGGAGGRCDLTSGCQFDSCTRAACASDGCTTASCVGSTCNRISGCSAAQMCCGGACVAAGCDDGNPCNGVEACLGVGSSARCGLGTAPCPRGPCVHDQALPGVPICLPDTVCAP